VLLTRTLVRTGAVLGAAALALGATALTTTVPAQAAARAASLETNVYSTPGTAGSFTVPEGVSSVDVVLIGAGGGGGGGGGASQSPTTV
jgi:hypothetical protein